MTTRMKSISGLIELPHPEKMESSYIPTELSITRFYGGKNRGVSVQLTLNREYIQIDHDSIKELINTLQEIWEYGQ